MTITFYGIPNCDTVKKARTWLDAHGHRLCLPRLQESRAPTPRRSPAGSPRPGWDKVLNRAGTTFRKLPESRREGLDEASAAALMAANPSCIKRPVLEHPGGLLVGFKPDEWQAALA